MTPVEELQRYADAYLRALVVAPHRTTALLTAEFAVSRATVNRRMREVQDRGLLPVLGEHLPAAARWANSMNDNRSWLACLGCHQPWPCPGVQEVLA